MPEKTKGRGGGFIANMVAVIGAIAALLTATGGFIQVVHPFGLGVDVEEASPTPSASASPTSTPSPTASATKTPTPTVTSQPTVAAMCVVSRISTTDVTVTKFEPALDDFGIPFFGDKVLRIRLPTRNVRIGVTVENHGTASLTLTSQNWRLFDGNPSYALMSPAPSPSPAYTSRIVAPGARFRGFLTFVGVPRDVTALQLEARFGNQSLTFKLPSATKDCP